MVIGRGKETTVLLVRKIAQQPFAQSDGLPQVALFAAGFVHVDEGFHEIGIILQVRIEVGFACPIGAIQASVRTESVLRRKSAARHAASR